MTGRPGTLIVAPYPEGTGQWKDPEAEAAVEALRAIVTRVRTFRSERGASPTAPVALSIDRESPGKALLPALETLSPLLSHLARLSDLAMGRAAPGHQDVVAGLVLGLDLPQDASPRASARIAKDLAAVDAEIAEIEGKLGKPSFVEKAPAAVVDKNRQRLRELQEKRAALGGSSS